MSRPAGLSRSPTALPCAVEVERRPGLVLRSARGRGVLAATILGSGLAQLDGTVVNVALPRIGRDLDAGLTALQWTVNAYTLTLAGLLLLGGSLGDRLGPAADLRPRRHLVHRRLGRLRRRADGRRADRACGRCRASAPRCSRPGSLAILEAVFRREDRAAAVGVVVRAGRRRHRDRPGARRRARRRRAVGLAAGVPDQRAARRRRHRAGRRATCPRRATSEATGRLDVPGAVLAALGLALHRLRADRGPAAALVGAAGRSAWSPGPRVLAGFLRRRGARHGTR